MSFPNAIEKMPTMKEKIPIKKMAAVKKPMPKKPKMMAEKKNFNFPMIGN